MECYKVGYVVFTVATLDGFQQLSHNSYMNYIQKQGGYFERHLLNSKQILESQY